jgi:hypothetical protein
MSIQSHYNRPITATLWYFTLSKLRPTGYTNNPNVMSLQIRNRIYISIRFEASQIKIERRPLGSSFNLDLHKVPFLQAGPMISTELNKPGPSWLFNSSIPQTFRSISAHPELRDRTGHLTPVQSLTAGPIGPAILRDRTGHLTPVQSLTAGPIGPAQILANPIVIRTQHDGGLR